MQFNRTHPVAEPECIFLHFINRELHDSLGIFLDTNVALEALRLATVFSDLPLLCNVSQIYEFAFQDEVLLKEIVELANNQVLDVDCGFPSFAEFHDSRRRYYQHDFSRYPMYAAERPDAIFSQFIFGTIPKVPSTTMGIQSRLESLIRENGDSVTALRPNERWLLRRQGKSISDALSNREDAGLTYSLFPARGAQFDNPDDEMTLRRALTAAYIDHYLASLHGDILTKYPRLGYYDNCSRTHASFFDLALMKTLEKVFGIDVFLRQYSVNGIEHRVRARNSPEQSLFVQRIIQLCMGLDEAFTRTNWSISRKDHWIRTVVWSCKDALKPRLPLSSLQELLLQSADEIAKISDLLSQRLSGFGDGWQKCEEATLKTTLLMTATDLEDDAFYEQAKGMGFRRIGRRTSAENVYTEFLSPSGKRLFHVRSSAGSIGSGGSMGVAMDALAHLSPTYVISAGICFGLDREKQVLEDVVVAGAVKQYEPGKSRSGKFLNRMNRM